MGEETGSDKLHKKLIKTSTTILLIVLLIVLIAEGFVIYNWQHNKVTSLKQQVKTLNIQLKYVQGEQDKLEKQIQ